ncbi:MAG TPA: aminopeptidase P family N-terminal domain-containing protein, partial [Steroidobacteraceae bacterium]
MSTVSRRTFFGLTAAGAALAASAKVGSPRAGAALSSITSGAQPIGAQEHGARLAKIQSQMQQRRIAALLVEAGSTLEYFTGIRWWRSERTTAAVIPAEGRVVVVTPFFEEPSIRETLKIPGDVRPWKEDESPFDLIAGALRDHAAAAGPLA